MKASNGNTFCSNTVFGDPIRGIVKDCRCLGTNSKSVDNSALTAKLDKARKDLSDNQARLAKEKWQSTQLVNKHKHNVNAKKTLLNARNNQKAALEKTLNEQKSSVAVI